MKVRKSAQALKPTAEVQSRGITGPTKRTDVLQIFFPKKCFANLRLRLRQNETTEGRPFREYLLRYYSVDANDALKFFFHVLSDVESRMSYIHNWKHKIAATYCSFLCKEHDTDMKNTFRDRSTGAPNPRGICLFER